MPTCAVEEIEAVISDLLYGKASGDKGLPGIYYRINKTLLSSVLYDVLKRRKRLVHLERNLSRQL